MFVRLSLSRQIELHIQQLVFCPGQIFNEGLHGCPALAMLTLMRPGSVVSFKPYVQVFLQLIYVEIDLLPESDNIEFLEYGLMEPLADAVCLRISLPHAQA